MVALGNTMEADVWLAIAHRAIENSRGAFTPEQQEILDRMQSGSITIMNYVKVLTVAMFGMLAFFALIMTWQ